MSAAWFGASKQSLQALSPFSLPQATLGSFCSPIRSFPHIGKDGPITIQIIPPVLCLPVERIDNSRVKSLEFEAKTSYTMHGFAGYFETVLYKDVTLSKYKL